MNGYGPQFISWALFFLACFLFFLNGRYVAMMIENWRKSRLSERGKNESTTTSRYFSEWLKAWSLKSKSNGRSPFAAMVIFAACLTFIVLGSVAIPVEHAAVVNQTKTIEEPLYIPHVSQDMDDYTFIVWPNHDRAKQEELDFCQDKGFRPPFAEGQTLRKLTFKLWSEPSKCLELISADCYRHWAKHSDGKDYFDCITQEEN